MQLIRVSTIPFVTLIWIGLSHHVNCVSNESSSVSDGLIIKGDSSSSGQIEGSTPQPQTPAPSTTTTINPSSSNSQQSTFFVTATKLPQYVYPESPTSVASTTEVPIVEEEDSQIAQPDFSPEQMDESPTEKEPESVTDVPQQDIEDINPTRVPMEETTLQEVDDLLNANNDENPNVSNELDAEIDEENDDNETDQDTDDESELSETLPTPMALISANGEGSNPSIDEEFAEAFKRVTPNGKRRRTRPSKGKKRVRMRVRKMNRLNSNSTEAPVESETVFPTLSYIEDETTTLTSPSKPRRYRSTTPSPDPSPPTISQSLPTFSSVVKKGPKPMIVTDIHSGSTGLNPVTSEPQLEKPTVGGFTEKISTYFITPPTKISTTKAPKIMANNDSNDNLDWSNSMEPNPGSNSLQASSSPYNSQGGAWEKNSFTGVSTERTEQSVLDPVVNFNEKRNVTEENSDTSLQQPTMENRAYTMQDPLRAQAQPGYEAENNYRATPSPHARDHPSVFDSSFNYDRQDPNANAGSHEPAGQQSDFLSRPPYNRYEENVPFVTNGQETQFPGSHYDRTKDAFVSANKFFTENSPFRGQEEGNPSAGYSDPQLTGTGRLEENNNNSPLPGFDQSSFPSPATPTLDHHYYSQDSDIIPEVHFEPQRQNRFPQQEANDYEKSPPFGDRFKSSPVDPTTSLDGQRNNNYPSTTQPLQNYLQNPYSFEDIKQANPPSGFSQEGSNGPTAQEFTQNIQSEAPERNDYTKSIQNVHSSPEQFPQDVREVTVGYSQNIPDSPAEYSQNNQVTPDISAYPESVPQNAVAAPGVAGQPPSEQLFATIENVPAYDVDQGNSLALGNPDSQRYPVFIAKSPGEPSRQPQFSPPLAPMSPMRPSFQRPPNFMRGNMPPPPPGPSPFGIGAGPGPGPGPGMHPGRFPPRPPNGPMFGPPGGPRPPPPPEFRPTPNVDLTINGINSISPVPSESQGLNDIQSNPNFPPHAHSMSDKPDYEPANPPLPHGHPLENHYESMAVNGNEGPNPNPQDGLNTKEIQTSNFAGQVESSNGNSQLTAPSLIQNDPSQGSNRPPPGYDIVSAYYDKPPPTVGYYGEDQHSYNIPPFQEVKNNDLFNVPFQYTSSDGGGLDGYSPNTENQEDKEIVEKPLKKEKKEHSPPEVQPSPEDESEISHYSHEHSKKNKSSSVYSDTPYVLMFPQLVPEEAMLPPPPKMLQEEIPVVQASSLSSMTFTPDGNPALGPGLKTVQVHPRHQMYQVLAKAHYDKTMQKYRESKNKPPSAIYTPYGVLIPMGPSASASTNHEIFAKSLGSHHQGHHHKTSHNKQLLNLLFGKKTPFGHLHLQKGAAFKNGRLKKHFNLKANVEPALDLLAEKLAIKLSAVKHVLSAPAKLGIQAFSKHSTSYSEHKPVVQEAPKDKGDVGQFESAGIENLLFGKNSDSRSSNNKEGKFSGESNKELKHKLKALLKDRLKEIMEEVEAESMEHGTLTSRSGPLMPMQSMMVETKVPPPNKPNRWTNYFSQSNQPTGGLIGTIKRLFSFGSDNDNNNIRSDNGLSPLNTRFSTNSTHPFGWYGGSLSALNSIGRMGMNTIPPMHHDQANQPMPSGSGWKTEKKSKKQLERWLDIVLKSSDSSASNQDPKDGDKYSQTQDKKRRGRNFDQPKDSSSQSSKAIKTNVSKKSSEEVSSSPKNEEESSLGKRMGQPAGSGIMVAKPKTRTFLPPSWKPMVSAFKSVFNYSSGKAPTILKPKPAA